MSVRTIQLHRDVLEKAQQSAEELRATMTARGVLVINLVSSPGAGKTTLLEATARHWQSERRMGVLVGDLATDRDAARLAPWVPVVQLTTGGACHLEPPLVQRGWGELCEQAMDYLFIENVGNLVCTASHDLGEHLRVVLLSVTEGDDKPAKYPKMFRGSDAMLISKTDLLPYVPFSNEVAKADAHNLQPELEVLEVSALEGDGIIDWCEYLESKRHELLGRDRAKHPEIAKH